MVGVRMDVMPLLLLTLPTGPLDVLGKLLLAVFSLLVGADIGAEKRLNVCRYFFSGGSS